MNITIENILLFGSILLVISIIASTTSNRFGLPSLILFLVVGMLAGSDGIGGVQFTDYKTAQFLGVVALNFILFSGGMDTKWPNVRPILWRGMALSTFGVFLTALSLGVFVHLITDFTLLEGLLLGAVVSSTDAAAVISILRTRNVGLKANLRPTLELESGSNDPMAYVLTISLIYLIQSGDANGWTLLWQLFQQMLLGAIFGYTSGRFLLFIINRIKLEIEGLYPVLLMAFIFLTYSATDLVGGNGFLAVYLCGIVLGNNHFLHKKSLIRFYDGQAWLMQIIMFLTLGLLVFPSKIFPLIGIGLLIAAFLIFVARPIGVFLSLFFFRMKTREKIFISWVGLRGAVPIIFATYPLTAKLEKAEEIFHLVFFISVTSVLLQGTTLSLVAKWLHLAVPVKFKRRSQLDLELTDVAKHEKLEYLIPEGSKLIGQSIVKMRFPTAATIVMLKRDNEYILPSGSTILECGDKLVILANNTTDLKEVNEALCIEDLSTGTSNTNPSL